MAETTTKTAKKQRSKIGSNPNSAANIVKNKFKPGTSGNPNGRPAGVKNRSTVLRHWLNAEIEVEDLNGETTRVTAEDGVILALIKAANNQNVLAIKEILDSTYGKLTEKVEVSDAAREAEIRREMLATFSKLVELICAEPETYRRWTNPAHLISDFLEQRSEPPEIKEIYLLGSGENNDDKL